MIPTPALVSIIQKQGHLVAPCKTTARLRVCNINKSNADFCIGGGWETIPADRAAFRWLDQQETEDGR